MPAESWGILASSSCSALRVAAAKAIKQSGCATNLHLQMWMSKFVASVAWVAWLANCRTLFPFLTIHAEFCQFLWTFVAQFSEQGSLLDSVTHCFQVCSIRDNLEKVMCLLLQRHFWWPSLVCGSLTQKQQSIAVTKSRKWADQTWMLWSGRLFWHLVTISEERFAIKDDLLQTALQRLLFTVVDDFCPKESEWHKVHQMHWTRFHWKLHWNSSCPQSLAIQTSIWWFIDQHNKGWLPRTKWSWKIPTSNGTNQDGMTIATPQAKESYMHLFVDTQ